MHTKHRNQRLNKQKGTLMNMYNTATGVIIAVTQSKWMRPALMAFVLLVAALGVVGCGDKHH